MNELIGFAKGWLLVEALIASSFRSVVEVLIEPEFSPKYDNKTKWAGYYRFVFLTFGSFFVFTNPLKCDGDELFVHLIKYDSNDVIWEIWEN